MTACCTYKIRTENSDLFIFITLILLRIVRSYLTDVFKSCCRKSRLLVTDKKNFKRLTLIQKALNVGGEEGGLGDRSVETPILWLLRQVASSFCVCSICMPCRSIILVVETLSATIRRHGSAPRR
jgi:hypothetical protein